MKVRMKAQISGSRDGQDWPAPGEEITVADDEGASLCASGVAEPVAELKQVETRPAKGKPETRES